MVRDGLDVTNSFCAGCIARRLGDTPMKDSIRLAAFAALLVPALLTLGGCKSDAQTGALIGAGAGAVGGYVIGNEMDKK
jgi:hypothetical protein